MKKKKDNQSLLDALSISLLAIVFFSVTNLIIETIISKKDYPYLGYSNGYITIGNEIPGHSLWAYLLSGFLLFLMLWYSFRKY